MRLTSLFITILLAGCGTVPPADHFANKPCLGDGCSDIQEKDSQISKTDTYSSDTQTVDDQGNYPDSEVNKDISTNQYICPNPTSIPLNCLPKKINDVQGKCVFDGKQDYLCVGFNAGKKCKDDADCQFATLTYEIAEQIAASGKCDKTKNPKCEGGFFEGNYCGGKYETLCSRNPIPPCVCWEFCDYIGTWSTFEAFYGTIYMDFNFLTEKNKTCQIGDYTAIPGSPKIQTTSGGATYELNHGSYCLPSSNILTSCSNKNNCKEQNFCEGKCFDGTFGSCISNNQCYKDYKDLKGCKSSACTFTGDVCNTEDKATCKDVYAPCQKDNDHLVETSCYTDGVCNNDRIWVRH